MSEPTIPTPVTAHPEERIVTADNGRMLVCDCDPLRDSPKSGAAFARRIAACLNVCADIPIEALERDDPGKLVLICAHEADAHYELASAAQVFLDAYDHCLASNNTVTWRGEDVDRLRAALAKHREGKS